MTEIYNIPNEDKAALKALFSNIRLIEQNKNLIYEIDDYYNIGISGFGVCLAHMETVPLFLGDLLKLWEHSVWRQDDNYCYFVMGSPRSNNNICHICNRKYRFIQKSIKNLGELAFPAFSLINNGTISNKICVQKSTATTKTNSHLSIFNLINKLKDKKQ